MIPTTEIELVQWMKQNCYNFDSYSINGNNIHEGYGIDRTNSKFIWYYTERGEKKQLATFETEREIIDHAFQEIKSDKWAKSHGIGFTTDISEITELAAILKQRAIEFYQDSIPYHARDKPMHRIFVFGCDVLLAEDLKSQYYKDSRTV